MVRITNIHRTASTIVGQLRAAKFDAKELDDVAKRLAETMSKIDERTIKVAAFCLICDFLLLAKIFPSASVDIGKIELPIKLPQIDDVIYCLSAAAFFYYTIQRILYSQLLSIFVLIYQYLMSERKYTTVMVKNLPEFSLDALFNPVGVKPKSTFIYYVMQFPVRLAAVGVPMALLMFHWIFNLYLAHHLWGKPPMPTWANYTLVSVGLFANVAAAGAFVFTRIARFTFIQDDGRIPKNPFDQAEQMPEGKQ